MTDRIYYTDPYCRSFDATVTDAFEHQGRAAVTLDRSAFYPTSGGQPFDIGRLGAVTVLETVDGPDVIHVVAAPIAPGTMVEGEIDWTRRFDHMQQHTGQHLLSAAFDRLFENPTVGFHMSEDVSTIDLALALSPEDIERAVDGANTVVWEDRPVSIRFATREEAASLRLRKEPAREGPLRLIDIEGFDVCACGGTHVARTGAVGLIAAVSSERLRGGARLTFVCGGRALRLLRAYRDAVAGSVRLLSVLPAELPSAIDRLQAESRTQARQAKELQGKLAGFEGAGLAANAAETGGVCVVVESLAGWDAAGLKAVASAVTAARRSCAVLFSAETPTSIVVACSPGTRVDAAALLRRLTERFGGRGGGKADLAQGGGLAGLPSEMASAARTMLEELLR